MAAGPAAVVGESSLDDPVNGSGVPTTQRIVCPGSVLKLG
jgi:hypothetical protein